MGTYRCSLRLHEHGRSHSSVGIVYHKRGVGPHRLAGGQIDAIFHMHINRLLNMRGSMPGGRRLCNRGMFMMRCLRLWDAGWECWYHSKAGCVSESLRGCLSSQSVAKTRVHSHMPHAASGQATCPSKAPSCGPGWGGRRSGWRLRWWR